MSDTKRPRSTTPAPITKDNATGLAPFNHPTRVVMLAEYAAAARALDALVHAANELGLDDFGQADFARMVADMVASLGFSQTCRDNVCDTMATPHRVTWGEENWFRAYYWCPACHRQHASGWSTTILRWL